MLMSVIAANFTVSNVKVVLGRIMKLYGQFTLSTEGKLYWTKVITKQCIILLNWTSRYTKIMRINLIMLCIMIQIKTTTI